MDGKMKEERGFTLVELMVVISITALLLAWGMPAYSTWKEKHDIENEIVQLYSDLQFARMTAYGNKVLTGVWWGGGANIAAYQIISDADGDGAIGNSSGDTEIGAGVTAKYSITSTVSQNSVSFDGRGFLNPPNPTSFYIASSSGAASDCVSVSLTRINVGKWDGTSCNPK
jgi:type IV fimbrial biogenesis protein FimT